MSDIILEWRKLQEELRDVKKRELELRNLVIEQNPGELGVSTINVDALVDIKITRGVSRSIDVPELTNIMATLTDEEKNCIVTKPTLDARKFVMLPKNNNLRRAVTVKPSQPSIKVILLEPVQQETE